MAETQEILDAKHIIATAATDACTTIAEAAKEAANVLAKAAAEAVKCNAQTVSTAQDDHETLQELKITFKLRLDDILEAIKNLGDGVTKQLDDHEKRIRILEAGFWKIVGMASLASVFVSLTIRFFEK